MTSDARVWVLAHGLAQREGFERGGHTFVRCCGVDWITESLELHLAKNRVYSEEDLARHRVEYALEKHLS